MMNDSPQEPRGAEISCAGPDSLISRQPMAVANGKVTTPDSTGSTIFRPLKTAKELSISSQCQHLIRPARSFVQDYMRWRYVAIARPLRNNRCIAARKVGDMTILRIAFQIACNYHSVLPTTDPGLTF